MDPGLGSLFSFVAGREMIFLHGFQLRRFMFASVRYQWATGVEATTGRWVNGRWNITDDYLALHPAVWIRDGNRCDKGCRIGVLWFPVHGFAICALNHLAEIHDSDSIRDVLDHRQIVSDKQI